MKKGQHVSEETRQKMSIAQKKCKQGKIIESPMKGKHHSEETKEKIRQQRLGSKQSEETIQKRIMTRTLNKNYKLKHTEETKKVLSCKTTIQMHEKWNKTGFLLDEKYCINCKQIKPVSEFGSCCTHFDGLSTFCLECSRIQKLNDYYARKKACLIYYSGNPPKCQCCGENIYGFLSIDHMNNDGGKHRREMISEGTDSSIYSWLVSHDFPEGFQVLCFNCNLGREHTEDKICPHKKKVIKNE
jgi:hypothetical protein